MKKKSFRKLKRLDLVELIYQMRKENIELHKRNKELERQLARAEQMAKSYASAGRSDVEQLNRIEEMLASLVNTGWYEL